MVCCCVRKRKREQSAGINEWNNSPTTVVNSGRRSSVKNIELTKEKEKEEHSEMEKKDAEKELIE